MSNLIDDFLANPIVGATATALVLAAIALWIAASWWTWRDATRRTGSSTLAFLASAWIIVSTPFLLPLSLTIYAVARPATTAADQRTESLVAALAASSARESACPGCAVSIDRGWSRCPRCATWLSAPCSACGEWSPADLELCPFCGREGHAPPMVEEQAAAVVGLGLVRRAPQLVASVARHSGV
jgi:hypothetical protein